MAEQTRKNSPRRRKPPAPPSAQKAACGTDDAAAETAHIESLVATGQAARTNKDGKLPPGATHEIVQDDKGETKVVRRRYSIA